MSEYVVVKFDERAVSLLTRILNIEYRRLQLELRMVEEKIKRFEKEYGMSSSEFLEKYSHGELGDEEEFLEWYGELKFLERINRELEELKKIAVNLSRKIPSESRR